LKPSIETSFHKGRTSAGGNGRLQFLDLTALFKEVTDCIWTLFGLLLRELLDLLCELRPLIGNILIRDC
jgi:hypothetical protein